MVRLVAPRAFRIPISRVRSVTETSMMFMMPMPPTSSDTAAMPASRTEKVCAASLSVFRMSAWLRTLKSSGRLAARRCERRSAS